MASIFSVIKQVGLTPFAAIQKKTPELVAKQLVGLAPDPLADALARGSGFERIAQALAPIGASFIPGGSTALQLSTSLTKSPVTIPTQQSLIQNLTTIAPLIGRSTPAYAGGRVMSFADGDSSGFSLPSLGDINDFLGGGFGQNLLNIGTQLGSSYLQGLGQSPAQLEVAGPIMRSIGMAGGIAGRMAGAIGRGFASRFPLLAGTLAQYRLAGKNVTRAQLWSLLKRFGPEFLVAGGILSAGAINELLIAGPGRRRMNPGNVKALRRCHRRMKAFHKIVQHNDYYLGSHRRKRSSTAGPLRTTITQVK
jgi:hypothetical protein